MKELANSLLQLVAVILIMITLAVSTAALSQWASPDAGANASNNGNLQQDEIPASQLSASVSP